MAIKFSQFNLRTESTPTMYLVGYDGNQNIHITVDNLISDIIDGTENTIAMFGPGGNKVIDSMLSQNAGATLLTVGGQLNVDGATTFDTSITVTGDSTLNGNVTLGNASDDLITQTGTLYLQGIVQDTTQTSGAEDQILVSDAGGLLNFQDLSATHVESAEVIKVPVKNLQGSGLTKGDPVYISGSVGESGKLEVKLADASNSAKMPAVGLLFQDLGINGEGYVVITGKLRNLTTDPIDGLTPLANDVIYVKPGGVTGDALTLTKPTGSNLIQNMGKVGRVSSANSGNFVVSSILRTNDIPNLTPGKIWVGSTGNTIESSSITFTEATGAVQLNEYGVGTHTGTVAKNLAVDASGNVIETSGNIIDGSGTANYLPRWTDADTLGDSGFYQISAPVTADKAIGLNTTKLGSTFGEYPDLRIASKSPFNNVPGVLDLFRKDGDVQAGDKVGILQYSVDDDAQYAVAQIEVETLVTSGVGDSGGGKFIFKTTEGGQIGKIPESRFELDSNSADFSVPINVTSTSQSSFAGQVTIPLNPVSARDAASKAYVDSQSGSGTVTGTGITNTLPIWSDGPNGVLGDSQITDNGTDVNISSNRNFNATRNFGVNEFNAKIDVGNGLSAGLVALEVRQKAYVRGGMVISPNPTNVQVDNSSLVIGSGSNDIVNGSDHCLTVGSGNQILNDSDRSVSFGNNNESILSDNSMNVGNTNILKYSNNSHIIGQNNQMGDEYPSNFSGFNNSLIIGSDNLLLTDDGSPAPSSGGLSFVIGHGNELRYTLQNSFSFGYSISNLGLSSTPHRNDFNIGGDLTAVNQTMTLGYRNDTTLYPTVDLANGLGETKFVVATGSETTANANALLITEGGRTAGPGGTVPMIPRVVLPTVTGFSASNDAAADALGVPQGALYQNQGVVQINRGGGSTTDPLAGGGGGNFVPISGGTMLGKLNVNYQNAEIEIRNNNFNGTRAKLTFGSVMSTDQASVQLNSNNDLEFRRGIQSQSPILTLQSSSAYFNDAIRIGANSTANELDDYEEGTYTPSLFNTGGIGVSYITRQGTYVKVGKMVFVKGLITVDILGFNSSSGSFGFSLPFTASSSSTTSQALGHFNPVVNKFITNGSTSNYEDTYNVDIVFNSFTSTPTAQFLMPSTSYGGSSTIATSSFLPATTGNSASFRFSGVYQSTI
jgi:hypothetical protein